MDENEDTPERRAEALEFLKTVDNWKPSRAQRREQDRQDRHALGRAQAAATIADQGLVRATQKAIKRRNGNPATAKFEVQSWLEIQNALRGHV